MKKSNMERFRKVVLWQWAYTRRSYLYAAGGFAAAVLLPALCGLALHRGGQGAMQVMGSLFDIAAVIYLLTCGALITSDISGKRERIAAFTLPATKGEKFVARYLHLVIGIPVAAFVGMIAGDLVQMLLSLLISGDSTSVTAEFFGRSRYLSDVDGAFDYGALMGILSLLFAHSFMMLCGICFRRHAWIKTMILQAALGTVVSTVLAGVGFAMMFALNNRYGEHNYNVVLVDNTFTQILYAAVLLALTAGCYWGTFRIYRRMQAN